MTINLFGYHYIPDSYITRGEFCKIIYNLITYKYDIVTDSPIIKYRDMLHNCELSDIIGRLSDLCIVQGYNDFTFRPEKFITRQEVLDILNNFRRLIGVIDDYLDITPISDTLWYSTDSENNIQGFPIHKFNGDSLIEKKEILRLIYNII